MNEAEKLYFIVWIFLFYLTHENGAKPKQHGKSWDLQPIAQDMKPTIYVLGKNFVLAFSLKTKIFSIALH